MSSSTQQPCDSPDEVTGATTGGLPQHIAAVSATRTQCQSNVSVSGVNSVDLWPDSSWLEPKKSENLFWGEQRPVYHYENLFFSKWLLSEGTCRWLVLHWPLEWWKYVSLDVEIRFSSFPLFDFSWLWLVAASVALSANRCLPACCRYWFRMRANISSCNFFLSSLHLKSSNNKAGVVSQLSTFFSLWTFPDTLIYCSFSSQSSRWPYTRVTREGPV